MTNESRETGQPEISDLDRIILFEWHARHLKSWRNTCLPGKISTNLLSGMDSETFHSTSIAVVLLRKFYAPKHAIKLPLVMKSLIKTLPPSEQTLLSRLKQEIQSYKQHIRQPTSTHGPKQLMPDSVVQNIQYGLLIHSDQERMEQLLGMPRGWMHEILTIQEGHKPVLELLATIESIRKDGTIDLPEPLDAIWEQRKPETMTMDEVKSMMNDLYSPNETP